MDSLYKKPKGNRPGENQTMLYTPLFIINYSDTKTLTKEQPLFEVVDLANKNLGRLTALTCMHVDLGDGDEQRRSRKIIAKSLYIKLQVQLNSRSEPPTSYRLSRITCWVYVVLDTKASDTLGGLTWSNIFDSSTFAVVPEYWLSKKYPNRFKILKIWRHTFEMNDVSIDWVNGDWSFAGQTCYDSIFLDLNDIEVNYKDNLPTNYDISVWAVHDSPLSSFIFSNVKLAAVSRLQFKDEK